jgi:molybdopterin synthase catalytic subunit
MIMTDIDVALLPDKLDPAREHADFVARYGYLGAVTAFTGVVRGMAKDGAVDYLYLDWYPGMTEASIEAIGNAAAERFDIAALVIRHRCAEVKSGQPVVFVAAASAHRRAAFEAVDYMMDRLKSEVALWKREVGPHIDRWIEPTGKDAEDLQRWSKP